MIANFIFLSLLQTARHDGVTCTLTTSGHRGIVLPPLACGPSLASWTRGEKDKPKQKDSVSFFPLNASAVMLPCCTAIGLPIKLIYTNVSGHGKKQGEMSIERQPFFLWWLFPIEPFMWHFDQTLVADFCLMFSLNTNDGHCLKVERASIHHHSDTRELNGGLIYETRTIQKELIEDMEATGIFLQRKQ